MAAYFRDELRRIIPRWRPSNIAQGTGEMSRGVAIEPGPPRDVDLRELDARLREFETYRTPAFAADLLGAAFAVGRSDVARHAAELVTRTPEASSLARSLAHAVLNDENEQPNVTEAAQEAYLRRRIRLYPRSAILWTDLALLRVRTADLHSAERSLMVALTLAPEHRFVLRSAARFWIHADQPDRAYALLHRSSATKNDPWLLAAEMASGEVAGVAPKSLRSARSMVESSRFSALHTAELATAIASAELGAGSVLKARRWFRRALVEPTENALAQVAWVARRDRNLIEDVSEAHAVGAWEAGAVREYASGNWTATVENSLRWQQDEPFSSRPAVLGGFVAAVGLRDYATARRILGSAMRANPHDFLVLNNLAFALASDDQPDAALRTLGRARSDELKPEERAVLLATQGLIRFRKGDLAGGDVLYRSAIQEAERLEAPAIQAMALVFLAREQHRASLASAEETIRQARDAWTKVEGRSDRQLAESVLETITRPAHSAVERITEVTDRE